MNKQLLITGATSGIGKATVEALATKGYNIHFLARNKSKSEILKSELQAINPNITVKYSICDLSLLKSIDATYDEIIDETDGKIDVLINNAGGIFTEAKDTKEGIEQTFAINHLGPFLLTEMLMTFLLKSKTRIINVSSAAHTQANWSLQNPESKSDWKPLISYANAKICNIYTAKYWANKYKDQGITAYALHPGVVRTGFGNEFNGVLKILLKIFQLLMISAKKGAKTSIYLATASDISEHSGKYFAKQKVKNCSNLANDLEKQQQLIDYSNQKIEEILPR